MTAASRSCRGFELQSSRLITRKVTDRNNRGFLQVVWCNRGNNSISDIIALSLKLIELEHLSSLEPETSRSLRVTS